MSITITRKHTLKGSHIFCELPPIPPSQKPQSHSLNSDKSDEEGNLLETCVSKEPSKKACTGTAVNTSARRTCHRSNPRIVIQLVKKLTDD